MFDQATTIETSTETTNILLQALQPSEKMRALDFVKRLAEDDGFREALMRNPVDTAASFGFTLDPAKLPKDGIKLPSRAVMSRYLDIMATRFSENPEVVIVFKI